MRLYWASFFLFAATLSAAAPAALRCGKLLDVRAGTEQANAVILVADGKISRVGPAAEVAIPAGATVIDLSGETCLPGLIDVHDHLTSDPSMEGYKALGVSIPRETVVGVKNARITLRAGFTTVRNLGAQGYSDVAVRDGIVAGEIEGPRLIVSGPPLSITGGHCDNDLLAPEYNARAGGVADGPWAARAKVREVVKYGADVIKVCASGGVMSKGDQVGTPQYSLEELQAIVEEAHKLGRKVAAHAHGTQSIKDSIRAGIDSVEHASLIDDEGIRLAKEHGTFLVYDIYNDDFIMGEGAKVGMLPESIEKERALGKLQRASFQRAYQAGCKLAFGTDGGVYPHGDNWKQFNTMVVLGMKPIDAIRTATLNAAELLGLSNEAGSIEAGFLADVIAVDGDPLQDVLRLGSMKFVMRQGVVYRKD